MDRAKVFLNICLRAYKNLSFIAFILIGINFVRIFPMHRERVATSIRHIFNGVRVAPFRISLSVKVNLLMSIKLAASRKKKWQQITDLFTAGESYLIEQIVI